MTAKGQPRRTRRPIAAKGRAIATTAGRSLASYSHSFREGWLAAATDLFRPAFKLAGEPLPDAGRAAIGFTSHGRRTNVIGECWNSAASADAHYEIFITPHKSDPIEVLGILAHELCHAALPLGSGHGPRFRKLALAIGLTGKMTATVPGPMLIEALKLMAAELGTLPHGELAGGRFGGGGGTGGEMFPTAPRKKQKVNMLRASCPHCDYVVRLTATHARKGAPFCGVHVAPMTVEWGDEG